MHTDPTSQYFTNMLLLFTDVFIHSLATKAWSLLREQLEKNPDSSGTLQRCVARKIITMGAQLPQWLVERYKVSNLSFFSKLHVRVCYESRPFCLYLCIWARSLFPFSLSPLPSLLSQKSNPAELLRMYLTFDLLEPATLLAIEFIDAVCGHGKEYFGLKVIKTLMIMGVNFLRWVIFHYADAPTHVLCNQAYCSYMSIKKTRKLDTTLFTLKLWCPCRLVSMQLPPVCGCPTPPWTTSTRHCRPYLYTQY